MRYCKTLELSDYALSDNFQHIEAMRGVFGSHGAPYPWGHEHRAWEYGLTLTALRENQTQTVLEVGGGASLFAAAAIWTGMEVLQVDPGHWEDWIEKQEKALNMRLPWSKLDFLEMDYPKNVFDSSAQYYDAVCCLSVIEHIPDDILFFEKLLKHMKPGGLLCLTTDFHPSGKGIFDGHIRTHNKESMMRFIELGQSEGFEVYGENPDYENFEPFIFNLYSFASLVLRKREDVI